MYKAELSDISFIYRTRFPPVFVNLLHDLLFQVRVLVSLLANRINQLQQGKILAWKRRLAAHSYVVTNCGKFC